MLALGGKECKAMDNARSATLWAGSAFPDAYLNLRGEKAVSGKALSQSAHNLRNRPPCRPTQPLAKLLDLDQCFL